MRPGKRTNGPCTLKLSYSQMMPANERGRLLELSHLRTREDDRGQGYATELLAMVCAEADNAKKVLVLKPDNTRLEMFYARFGFFRIHANPPIMARQFNSI